MSCRTVRCGPGIPGLCESDSFPRSSLALVAGIVAADLKVCGRKRSIFRRFFGRRIFSRWVKTAIEVSLERSRRGASFGPGFSLPPRSVCRLAASERSIRWFFVSFASSLDRGLLDFAALDSTRRDASTQERLFSLRRRNLDEIRRISDRWLRNKTADGRRVPLSVTRSARSTAGGRRFSAPASEVDRKRYRSYDDVTGRKRRRHSTDLPRFPISGQCIPTSYLAPLPRYSRSKLYRSGFGSTMTSQTGRDDAIRNTDHCFLLVLNARRPRISHRYRDIAVRRWTGSGFGHTVTSR
jgi:hypothetical protein